MLLTLFRGMGVLQTSKISGSTGCVDIACISRHVRYLNFWHFMRRLLLTTSAVDVKVVAAGYRSLVLLLILCQAEQRIINFEHSYTYKAPRFVD